MKLSNPSDTPINYTIIIPDEIKSYIYWECNNASYSDYWCPSNSYRVNPHIERLNGTEVKMLFLKKTDQNVNFETYFNVIAMPIGLNSSGEVGLKPQVKVRVIIDQKNVDPITTATTTTTTTTTSSTSSNDGNQNPSTTTTTTTPIQTVATPKTTTTSKTTTTTSTILPKVEAKSDDVQMIDTTNRTTETTEEENKFDWSSIALIVLIFATFSGFIGFVVYKMLKSKNPKQQTSFKLTTILLAILTIFLLTNLATAFPIKISVDVKYIPTNLTVDYNPTTDAEVVEILTMKYTDINNTKIGGANVSVYWNGTLWNTTENSTGYYWDFPATIHGENVIQIFANKTDYDPKLQTIRIYVLDSLFKIRFWTDLNATTKYINEFSYVYLRDENCNQLGLWNCSTTNDVCFHAKYVQGEGDIRTYYDRNWTLHFVSGADAVHFDTNISCPRIEKYDFWVQVDKFETKEEGTYEFDYMINTTLAGKKPAWYQSYFRWELWSKIICILVLLAVLIVVGYLTKNGIVSVIAMVLVYVIMRYFRIF